MLDPTKIKDQINNELEELHLILQYSREKTAMLSAGERIMINQERASLFRALAGHPTSFVQSEVVEQKKQEILMLIKRTRWEPLN